MFPRIELPRSSTCAGCFTQQKTGRCPAFPPCTIITAKKRWRTVNFSHALFSEMWNGSLLVEGTAGSGKTLLALEFSLSLASRGESVLFLCYNRHLSSWLQEQTRHDPRARRAGERLRISTFHAFARKLATLAGVEFDVPSGGEQTFWDEDVPLIMEQALEVLRARGTPECFDAIVVDEAQDFAPEWWVTVESLSRAGASGQLYAFLDLNQSLRGIAKPPPVPFSARFRLATNCRNTKAIARSGALLAQIDVQLLPSSPTGKEPSVRRAVSDAAEAGLVLAEVRQLLRQGIKPSQLALIGSSSFEHGCLCSHNGVDGIPFTSDALDWARGGGILVTTARAFKAWRPTSYWCMASVGLERISPKQISMSRGLEHDTVWSCSVSQAKAGRLWRQLWQMPSALL